MLKSIGGAIVAAALAGAAHAEAPTTVSQMRERLVELSGILENDYPEIVGKSDFETALILRDAISRGVANGTPPKEPKYAYGDPVRSYEQSFYEGYATLCGGYSQLFVFMLEARGINARRVGMWAATDENALTEATQLDGHVSVEVFLDGSWIAMDPTFNITLRDEHGDAIGWREARFRYLTGRDVVPDTDGNLMLPDEKAAKDPLILEEYYIPLAELIENLTVGPGERGEKVINIGWDGYIHYASGDVLDYGASYMGVPDILTARIGG